MSEPQIPENLQTPQTPQTDEPDQPAGARFGRRRRAPRYGSFVVTGALVGVVLAVVLSFSRPTSGQYSQNSVIGYVAAILGLLGALVGGVVAILFDRRGKTRA